MRISDWSSDVCSSDLLTGEGASLVELNFQKSIEARAPASIKALAVDLDCYASFSAERGGIGLPADEARPVAITDYCEARRLKPARYGEPTTELQYLTRLSTNVRSFAQHKNPQHTSTV